MSAGIGTVDTGTIKSEEKIVQITQIPIDYLAPFKYHCFKPYSEEQMRTLVASVRENGVIHPIIVRRKKSKDGHDMFEIVSGHNRVGAARTADLHEIPAVIRELSDDEAIIFANESNIESRNYAIWLPSEKIKSVNQYHEASKRQGKQKGLLPTSGNNRQKPADSYARKRTAEVYGENPSKIRLYIELNRLIEPFLDKLDANSLRTTPASELSFIPIYGQKLINSVLDEDVARYKVSVQSSRQLRKYIEDSVEEFQPKRRKSPSKKKYARY